MKTILAVDDNRHDLLLLQRALSRCDTDHCFLAACDGALAQGLLDSMEHGQNSSLPSLIFLDVHMPGADGFELLDRWKHTSRFSAIPVVMISTFDNPRDIERAISLGANACLRKPPTVEELRRIMQKLTPDNPTISTQPPTPLDIQPGLTTDGYGKDWASGEDQQHKYGKQE